MSNEKLNYQKDYDEFISGYQKGTVDGEDAGHIIANMAQYFCDLNASCYEADKNLNKAMAQMMLSVDDSGKPISVAKADLMIKDTDEYRTWATAKMHLQNIDQIINALKYLQKGILQEYGHMGTM